MAGGASAQPRVTCRPGSNSQLPFPMTNHSPPQIRIGNEHLWPIPSLRNKISVCISICGFPSAFRQRPDEPAARIEIIDLVSVDRSDQQMPAVKLHCLAICSVTTILEIDPVIRFRNPAGDQRRTIAAGGPFRLIPLGQHRSLDQRRVRCQESHRTFNISQGGVATGKLPAPLLIPCAWIGPAPKSAMIHTAPHTLSMIPPASTDS